MSVDNEAALRDDSGSCPSPFPKLLKVRVRVRVELPEPPVDR